jgi:ribosome maturation factor RimP
LREAVLSRIKEIVDQAAVAAGLEVMQVEMVGGGKHRLLRITLDKDVEGGVSLDECEAVSHQVSAVLDAEDLIPGDSYQLEVGSPGIERALSTPRDYARFTGKLAKLVLREPIGKHKTLIGRLAGFSDGVVTLEVDAEPLAVPLDNISKANLKFEWPK